MIKDILEQAINEVFENIEKELEMESKQEKENINYVEIKNPVKPNHYKLDGLYTDTGAAQVKDVIKSVLGEQGYKNWIVGDALAYVMRHENKNGLEDIKKAIEMLGWLVND